MSGYINGANISDIYHGNDYIETVYKGNELIFDNSDILKKYIEGRSSFTVPQETTVLRRYCFYGLNELKKVDFEEPCQITNLSYMCFGSCKYLEFVRLPNSIINLEQYCFRDCSQLSKLELPSSLQIIGSSCFDGCGITQLTVPMSVITLDRHCFSYMKQLTNIEFEFGCQITVFPTNCLANCTSLQSVVIPDSVEEINSSCFYNCNNLTTITINKPTDSISGAPWGAPNATVIWNSSVNPTKPDPY